MSFWKEKSLTQMSREEWESLCDHCGKCCLMKLEDEDDEGSIYYTSIVCDLFNKDDGSCTDYLNREKLVPTCLRLTQDNLEQIEWMPPSCAYRRVIEGRGLAKWHHLVSGDKKSIHETGNSVLDRVVFEKYVDEDDLEEYIVTWPLK
jgi:uncharacterized cysteine cluster protein YcgN (CxxCxxCC family)